MRIGFFCTSDSFFVFYTIFSKKARAFSKKDGRKSMKELTIGPNDAGQRIDKFMSKRFRTMPTFML